MVLVALRPVGSSLDQGLNLCLLHWQADSLPPNHKGNAVWTKIFNYIESEIQKSERDNWSVMSLLTTFPLTFKFLTQQISYFCSFYGPNVCVTPINSWASMNSVVKNLPANAGDSRDLGSVSGLGRSSGVGNGNSLQYSCLEKSHGQRSLVGYCP